ncbi:helix-turn-helix transcriptional regulator [Parvibaculum sedimenti]|uniref:helix-turn-helix transcriptional regulator n=1 Tax=Parvibaculum sedimenti TaxID=2608632 RepID=UPI003BB6B42E
MNSGASIISAVEFGRRAIRLRRKAVGLSQTELATAMGTTRQLLSALERGARGVSIDMALVAATELGLELRLVSRS